MKSHIKDKLLFVPFVLGLVVLSFLTGAAVYHFKIFPYAPLRDAFVAALAFREKYGIVLSAFVDSEKFEMYEDLWFKVEDNRDGLILNRLGPNRRDVTFFSTYEPSAYLIDISGNILHRWHKPFSEVWPNPTHLVEAGSEDTIYWHKAVPFPNGDIIAIYQGINQLPYGAGLAKLDEDSNLIWKLDISAHHDLDIAEDGTIYALMHEFKRLKNPVIEDQIAIISPDGKLLRKISLLDVVLNSDYRWLLGEIRGDVLHANDIDILDAEMAESFPAFRPGDLLVSFRDINTLMVLDHETFSPLWAVSGMTNRQHDPDFLPDGTILVFDNRGSRSSAGGRSRILQIDAETKEVVSRYAGDDDRPFNNRIRGSQQALPGGGILITESDTGSIFEITPKGKIVWEYRSPFREGESRGILCGAERFGQDFFTFLK
jgi:hypothetical protein